MKKYILFITVFAVSLAVADCPEELNPDHTVTFEVERNVDPTTVPPPSGPTITYEVIRTAAAPEKPLFYNVTYKDGGLQFKTEFFADAGELHYFSNAGGFEFTYVGKLKMSDTELARLKAALTLAAKTSKRTPSVSHPADLVELGGIDPETGAGFVLERRSGSDTYVNTATTTFQLTQLIRWLSEP